MVAPEKVQELYEEIAERHEWDGDPRQRDIFLVLAADAALAHGRFDQAERLRQRLFELSPHNMLRPFASLSEALQSADILEYVSDLRQQFPADKAEKLLQSLGGAAVASVPDSPFGQEVYTLQDPAPATVPSPFFSHATPAAAAPAKQRRRSPYENPDYGPRVPAGGASREFTGTWIIFLLCGLVILLGLGLLVHVLGRPFWPR